MRRLFILLALALPVPAQQPDPARLEAARSLVAQVNLGSELNATMQAMRAQLAVRMRQRFPALSEAAVLAIPDEFILPEVASRGDEVTEATVVKYATHLTVPEMNDLAAFHTTPTGRRLAEVMPMLTAQMIQFSEVWNQRVVQDAINKHREALRARGVNL